jgi:hypothetical protein
MCVAIYKPIGAELPTKKDLYNCYISNSDGAGFAYCRNNKIHIKKGYMDFNEFYKDFLNENFQVNENVFIHFRIATHGLVDGGNTHPFPVTNNFDEMRKTNNEYQGKCLIHNGIFHYGDNVIKSYSKIISDTMLFSRFLFEQLRDLNFKNKSETQLSLEESVAKTIFNHSDDNFLHNHINQKIGYSKIAVMNEDGSVNIFGNWIEHNGVFYSNNSYEDYRYRFFEQNNYSYNRSINYYQKTRDTFKHMKKSQKNYYHYCDFCNEFSKDCFSNDGGFVCRKCVKAYDLRYCYECETFYDKNLMVDRNTCCYCKETTDNEINNNYKLCLCCGQNYKVSEESKEKDICRDCYQMYMC